MNHTQNIHEIARARAPFCKIQETGRADWPFVLSDVPYEDVTRTADALQRSRYSTQPDHDRGLIWVVPQRR